MLSSDSLPIGEYDAFGAALEWIEHDKPNRIGYLSELLGLIRFPVMRPDQLVIANESSLAHEDADFERILFEAFLFHHGKEKVRHRPPSWCSS